VFICAWFNLEVPDGISPILFRLLHSMLFFHRVNPVFVLCLRVSPCLVLYIYHFLFNPAFKLSVGVQGFLCLITQSSLITVFFYSLIFDNRFLLLSHLWQPFSPTHSSLITVFFYSLIFDNRFLLLTHLWQPFSSTQSSLTTVFFSLAHQFSELVRSPFVGGFISFTFFFARCIWRRFVS
jgi:hypothetical protein